MFASRKRDFRDYAVAENKVRATYQQMQEGQTELFVDEKKKLYGGTERYRDQDGNKVKLTLDDVSAILDKIIDESDPDTKLPQLFHAYQTGEALKKYLQPANPAKLREDISVKSFFTDKEWRQLPHEYRKRFSVNLHELYPHIQDWSWLPLVGFMHDSGKVLAAKEWGELPQWAVVGDTFPICAPFSKANIFYDQGFFKANPSLIVKNNKLKTFGAYPRNCGFDHVKMSWGHDEYLHAVLSRTAHRMPPEALYIIRFHSFYPWHTPRTGKQGYKQLASGTDWLRLPLLKAFQKSDLYSKDAQVPDPKQLQQFYRELMDTYFPPRPDHRPAKIGW